MSKLFNNFILVVSGAVLGPVILFLFILSFCYILYLKSDFSPKNIALPHTSYLVIELKGKMDDYRPQSSFGYQELLDPSMEVRLDLFSALKGIKEAKEDPLIGAIVLDFKNFQAGFSTIEELRRALEGFKKAEKKVFAFSENFDQKSYYLASVADIVISYAESPFVLKGLAITSGYLKSLFDQVKVIPYVFKKGKYKSSPDQFSKTRMSREEKEQNSELLEDFWQKYVSTIAQARKLTENDIQSWAELLLIRKSQHAKEHGLIDKSFSDYEMKKWLTNNKKVVFGETIENFFKDEETEKKVSKEEIFILKDFEDISISMVDYIHFNEQKKT